MESKSSDKSKSKEKGTRGVGVNKRVDLDGAPGVDWRTSPAVLSLLFILCMGIAATRMFRRQDAGGGKEALFVARQDGGAPGGLVLPSEDPGNGRSIGSSAVETGSSGQEGPTDASGEMVPNLIDTSIDLKMPVPPTTDLHGSARLGGDLSRGTGEGVPYARADGAGTEAPLLTHPKKAFDVGNPGGYMSQHPKMPSDMQAMVKKYGGRGALEMMIARAGGSLSPSEMNHMAGAARGGAAGGGPAAAGDQMRYTRGQAGSSPDFNYNVPLMPPEVQPFPAVATCITEYGDVPCKIAKNIKYGDSVTDMDGLPLDGVQDGKYFDANTNLPPICRIARVGRGHPKEEHRFPYNYPWSGAVDQTACGNGEGCRLDASQPPTYFHNGSVIQCISPIAFDLDGRGVRTATRWAMYDLAGDGTPQRMRDLAQGVGLLAFDWDKSGVSGKDGRGLFGTQTSLSGSGKPDGYMDGFEAFAAFVRKAEAEGVLAKGVSARGTLDASDLRRLEAAYGLRMRVGGLNGRAVSLAEAGVASIRLSNAAGRWTRDFDGSGDDRLDRAGASFTRTDGTAGVYADVFFRVTRPAELRPGIARQEMPRIFRMWPGALLHPMALWLR